VRSLSLLPYTLHLHVMEEKDSLSHPFCLGEILVTFDSDDTAWVEPCSRLTMTEEVVSALADVLRPYGTKWMRGWHDNHYVGRVITADGNLGETNDYPPLDKD